MKCSWIEEAEGHDLALRRPAMSKKVGFIPSSIALVIRESRILCPIVFLNFDFKFWTWNQAL